MATPNLHIRKYTSDRSKKCNLQIIVDRDWAKRTNLGRGPKRTLTMYGSKVVMLTPQLIRLIATFTGADKQIILSSKGALVIETEGVWSHPMMQCKIEFTYCFT